MPSDENDLLKDLSKTLRALYQDWGSVTEDCWTEDDRQKLRQGELPKRRPLHPNI